MSLFQSDFRAGVQVLNRLLNHVALARVRGLASYGHYGVSPSDEELDAYRTELDVTGAPRTHVGDSHVWTWYRGTGVGPYPCMSALQALERVCYQLIEIDIPLSTIVTMLLDGCENLAMVGFVVGLLVRHLEKGPAADVHSGAVAALDRLPAETGAPTRGHPTTHAKRALPRRGAAGDGSRIQRDRVHPGQRRTVGCRPRSAGYRPAAASTAPRAGRATPRRKSTAPMAIRRRRRNRRP
jgi:hypothetical protein